MHKKQNKQADPGTATGAAYGTSALGQPSHTQSAPGAVYATATLGQPSSHAQSDYGTAAVGQPSHVQPSHAGPVAEAGFDVDCPAFSLEADYTLPSSDDMSLVRDIKLSSLTAAKWGQFARDALEAIDFLEIWSEDQKDFVGSSVGQVIATPAMAAELLVGAIATAVVGPFSNLYEANAGADDDEGNADEGAENHLEEDIIGDEHPSTPTTAQRRKSKK